MTKNRSRRLRKKLRLGEFQELAFEIHIVILENADIDAFMDRWLEEVVLPNGMECFSTNASDWFAPYLSRKGRGTLTEADRVVVEDWLTSQPQIRGFKIGPLEDMWHHDPNVERLKWSSPRKSE